MKTETIKQGVADSATSSMIEESTTLVIGFYPGTLDIVKKLFDYSKLPEDCKTIFIEAPESGDTILEIIAQAASLPDMPEEFILVPCGCIPCGGFDMNAMRLSTVYVDRTNHRIYNSGLPLVINLKEALEVIRKAEENHKGKPNEVVAEEFTKEYIETYRPKPVCVSFSYGNYVTPVKRSNPCENIVIQAFIQKKFVTANREGFEAIIPLLQHLK